MVTRLHAVHCRSLSSKSTVESSRTRMLEIFQSCLAGLVGHMGITNSRGEATAVPSCQKLPGSKASLPEKVFEFVGTGADKNHGQPLFCSLTYHFG